MVLPAEASKLPTGRIFSRPNRKTIKHKNNEGNDMPEAKTRLVTPGDVGPDGDIPVEDGGFRTDTPTYPQVALHTVCSLAVRKRRQMGTLDCNTAFLTGTQPDSDIGVRPPHVIRIRRLWFTRAN